MEERHSNVHSEALGSVLEFLHLVVQSNFDFESVETFCNRVWRRHSSQSSRTRDSLRCFRMNFYARLSSKALVVVGSLQFVPKLALSVLSSKLKCCLSSMPLAATSL